MYLEKIYRKHGNKEYISTLVRESYRDKGKVKHRTIANLSKLPPHIIQNIEMFFSNKTVSAYKLDEIKISSSREYGASSVFMELAKQLKLDKIIYSKKLPWRQNVLAMIVGRLIYQGSKLHLTQLHQDSILWELAGFKGQNCPDVKNHCYIPLDLLLERQDAIQTELAKKHLNNGSVILYDITSSYLEGEYKKSELVDFGYSRDNKRGCEQIVIGLLANKIGCPVAVEVFRGNTSDQTTVFTQAKKLADSYKVKDVIFVGDRGMLTPKRITEVNELGYKTLTALSRKQIYELLHREVIDSKQFSVDEVIEVSDPIDASVRYFLCKNPGKEIENKETRNVLIEKTTEGLEKISICKKRTEQQCAKISLTDLAGESPVVEVEPITLRSESCVTVGNESDEA